MESSDPRINGGTYGSAIGGETISNSRRVHGNLTETLNQFQSISSNSPTTKPAGERGNSVTNNYSYSDFDANKNNDNTTATYSHQYPYLSNQNLQSSFPTPLINKDAGVDNSVNYLSAAASNVAPTYPAYNFSTNLAYFTTGNSGYSVPNSNYADLVGGSSGNSKSGSTYIPPNGKYPSKYTYLPAGYSTGSSQYNLHACPPHQAVPGVFSGDSFSQNSDFRSPSTDNQSNAIDVSGLPDDVFIEQIASFFGEFGALKMDRQKDPPQPSIQLLKKGEARIVFETHDLAKKAVEYFQGKRWAGQGFISVCLATPLKDSSSSSKPYSNRVAGRRPENYPNNSMPSGRVEPYSVYPYHPYPPPSPSLPPSSYCPSAVYAQIPNSTYENQSFLKNFSGFKGRGGPPREGDWVCPECGNLNFKFRNECHQCNVLRPTHAQVLMAVNSENESRDDTPSSSSMPTLRIGDWMCPSCNFQNFARRESCHKCYTVKPALRKEPTIERKQERSRVSGPY